MPRCQTDEELIETYRKYGRCPVCNSLVDMRLADDEWEWQCLNKLCYFVDWDVFVAGPYLSFSSENGGIIKDA